MTVDPRALRTVRQRSAKPAAMAEPVGAPPDAMKAICAALADLAYDVAVARMNEQEAKSA